MIEIPNNDPDFVKNLTKKRREKKIDAAIAYLLKQLENDCFQAEYTIDGSFPTDLAKEVARLFLAKGYNAYIFKSRNDSVLECNFRMYLCISRVPKTEYESRRVNMVCDIGLEEAKKTAIKNELRREVEHGKEAWREFWGDSAAVDLAERLEFLYEKDTKKSSVYWNSPSDDIQRSTDLPRVLDYDTQGWTEEYEAWGVKMITRAVEAGCTDATSVENWIRREVDKNSNNNALHEPWLEFVASDVAHDPAWRNFWGDAATVNLATRLMSTYETYRGKSSVYWTSPSKELYRSIDLPRPDGCETEGWTDDYQAWGVFMISKAIRSGCTDAISIENWIRRSCGEVINEKQKAELSQEQVREFILKRCKDCLSYAPMILPEVISYLECEKSGDWSGWKLTGEAKR